MMDTVASMKAVEKQRIEEPGQGGLDKIQQVIEQL